MFDFELLFKFNCRFNNENCNKKLFSLFGDNSWTANRSEQRFLVKSTEVRGSDDEQIPHLDEH